MASSRPRAHLSRASASNSDDCKCNISDEHSEGYFGLHPFDLALLASDVDDWSSDGLNLEHAKICLDNSHFFLGSSLRAKTADATQLEVLKDKTKRINNEDLKLSPVSSTREDAVAAPAPVSSPASVASAVTGNEGKGVLDETKNLSLDDGAATEHGFSMDEDFEVLDPSKSDAAEAVL